MLLKTMILTGYHIKFHIAGVALIGALILGKVVLIFDNLPILKKYKYLPKIYDVFIRSFVYLGGYIIFTLVEELIKGIIKLGSFTKGLEEAFRYLGTLDFLTHAVIIFISFLFFNTIWIVRNHISPKALHQLFFKREDQ